MKKNAVIGQCASDHPLPPVNIRFQSSILETPQRLVFIEKESSGKSNLYRNRIATKVTELKRVTKERTMNGRASLHTVLQKYNFSLSS